MEGDGCFSHNVQRRGERVYKYPTIVVTQNNLEPLVALKEFGWSVWESKDTDKQRHRAYIYGNKARKMFFEIAPLLTSKRIQQARNYDMVWDGQSREHTIAWAAGFYEAEGCLHTRKNGYVRKDGTQKEFIQLDITQYYTNEPLFNMYKVLECGNVIGPYVAYETKDAFYFRITRTDDCISSFRRMSKYLSEKKNLQFTNVLDRLELND